MLRRGLIAIALVALAAGFAFWVAGRTDKAIESLVRLRNARVPEKFATDLKQITYTACRSAHEESIAYRTAKLTRPGGAVYRG
jgi:hypothetical protein